MDSSRKQRLSDKCKSCIANLSRDRKQIRTTAIRVLLNGSMQTLAFVIAGSYQQSVAVGIGTVAITVIVIVIGEFIINRRL